MSVSTTPPEIRVRSWHAWLLVWRVHRVLGLFFAALLVLLSLTGSLLVVHHELEAVFERRLHVAPETPETAAPAPALADIAAAVAARAPEGCRLFRILPAREPGATHKVMFLSADGKTRWSAFVVPATGEIRWSGPDQRLFTPWLLGLHMQLQAGRAGYYVTGLAGIALTLLGLSGLYLHRERLTALARHPFRLRLGWRVALADLHKWVGVFTLYFPLVLGVTGTLYVIASLDAKPAATRAPIDPAALPPLEPLIAAARARFPGAEVLRVQLPADPAGPVTVLVLHRANPPWQKFSNLTFDVATGRPRGVRDATQLPAADQFRSMLAPLHFGFYGASWVKWAYFLGGLAPAVLAGSGVALWWVRRRAAGSGSAGRPANPRNSARDTTGP
jgi:uncharacterized iron-regulated membrane protein